MWLFGVARRVLSQHYRSAVRRSALGERLRSELATWCLVQSGDDGRGAAVREAIEKLSSADRELVRLVHWDGFALNDAASILRIRPGTARMRYQRARERLRNLLGTD